MTSRKRNFAVVTLPVCAAVLLVGAWLTSAGDLNPPAAPVAPTMKTLVEVEPRTAINATNTPGDATSIFRITAPGSYYLTGNVAGTVSKSGIKVAVSNVTIDLCGFSLTGVVASHDGIQGTSGTSNVSVFNGHITDWSSWGIDLDNVTECRIRDVTCESNLDGGIRTDTRSHVENCVCTSNDGEGIRISGVGAVYQCVCTLNTQNGIFVTGGTQGGGVVDRCVCHSNSSAGVRVASYCIVSRNTCNFNGNIGIGFSSDCNIVSNNCNNNTTDGVQTAGNNNRIEDNNACNNTQRGLFVSGTRNFIVRNTASNNGVAGAGDFSFSSPNVYGEINNFVAGAAMTANPWTNIKY